MNVVLVAVLYTAALTAVALTADLILFRSRAVQYITKYGSGDGQASVKRQCAAVRADGSTTKCCSKTYRICNADRAAAARRSIATR